MPHVRRACGTGRVGVEHQALLDSVLDIGALSAMPLGMELMPPGFKRISLFRFGEMKTTTPQVNQLCSRLKHFLTFSAINRTFESQA